MKWKDIYDDFKWKKHRLVSMVNTKIFQRCSVCHSGSLFQRIKCVSWLRCATSSSERSKIRQKLGLARDPNHPPPLQFVLFYWQLQHKTKDPKQTKPQN